MKKKLIAGLLLVVAVLAAALVLHLREPGTPEGQWARAERTFERCEGKTGLTPPRLRLEREGVLAEYRKVWERFPPGPFAAKARRKTGRILERWGRLREALEAYRAFMAEFPEDPAACDVLWDAAELAHRKMASTGEAVRLYRLFSERFPKDARAPAALAERAVLMQSLGRSDPAEVQKVWQQIVDAYPESRLCGRAWIGIAEIRIAGNDFNGAMEVYDRVIGTFKGEGAAAEALLRKGMLLAGQEGREEASIEVLAVLEKEYPDFPAAKEGSTLRRRIEAAMKARRAAEREREYLKERVGLPCGDVARAATASPGLLEELIDQALDFERVVVTAEIDPEKGTMSARASVHLLNRGEKTKTIAFRLNPGLRIEEALVGGRIAVHKRVEVNPLVVTVTFPVPWMKGSRMDLTLMYSGGGAEGLPMRLASEGYAAPGSFWHPLNLHGDLFIGGIALRLPKGLEVRSMGRQGEVQKEEAFWNHGFEAREPVNGFSFAYGSFDLPEKIRNETADLLRFYEGRFGPLPWKRVDLVKADLVSGIGGVSAPGMVFLSPKLLGAASVPEGQLAHQLAHQWWGGRVPIAASFRGYGPWLCEGLAAYSDLLALERKEGRQAMERRLAKGVELYLRRAEEFTDVPIADCLGASGAYDAVAVMKAAAVFHLLRRRMGEEAFFKALQGYAKACERRPAGFQDFRLLMERACGRSLEVFFARWIQEKGVPQLRIGSVETGKPLRVTIAQTGTVFPFDLTVAFEGGGKREERVVPVEKETETFEATLPFEVERIVLDPAGVVPKRPGSQNTWTRPEGK